MPRWRSDGRSRRCAGCATRWRASAPTSAMISPRSAGSRWSARSPPAASATSTSTRRIAEYYAARNRVELLRGRAAGLARARRAPAAGQHLQRQRRPAVHRPARTFPALHLGARIWPRQTARRRSSTTPASASAWRRKTCCTSATTRCSTSPVRARGPAHGVAEPPRGAPRCRCGRPIWRSATSTNWWRWVEAPTVPEMSTLIRIDAVPSHRRRGREAPDEGRKRFSADERSSLIRLSAPSPVGRGFPPG